MDLQLLYVMPHIAYIVNSHEEKENRKKNKSCTRFINVDIGLSGSPVAGAAVDARLCNNPKIHTLKIPTTKFFLKTPMC